MAIFVTGTPGAGKTTLVNYARTQEDNRFFDADEIVRLCEWREFEQGKVLELVSEHEQKSNDDWFKRNGWYWQKEKLLDFIEENPDAVVCGSSENIAECYQLFDKIVILKKSESELLQNLQSPERKNPFGKTIKQRQGFMQWQSYLINEAEKHHPIIFSGNDISKTYKQVAGILNQ